MTDKWIMDTGLVFVVISSILAFKVSIDFLWAVIILSLVLIFYPRLLWPLGYVWQKLAVLLNFIFSKVFFAVIFFLIITPISFVRKLFKKDPMNILDWKSIDSAYVDREHLYVPEDFNKAV